ncbi:MAG: phosphatase PAP2 family protein [Parcubacteria group bacterium]
MDELLEKIFSNEFEKEVLAWFFENKTEFGVSFFEAISLLGDWKLLMPLILIIITILFLKGKHKLLLPLLVSVLGTESATLFLKDWFGRARPTFIPTEHLTASFPSAHASIAIGFYGYLGYILIKFGNPKHKALIFAIISLIIILVGFSRVYLTVHYPSDVVVGYLIGLLFFAIGVAMTEAQFKEVEKEVEEIEEELGVKKEEDQE